MGQQNNGAKPSFIPTEVPSSEPNSDTVTFTEAEYSEPTEPQYAEETKPIDAFETADSQTDFAEPVEAEETDKTGFESADNSDKDEYIPKDDNSDTDDTFKM